SAPRDNRGWRCRCRRQPRAHARCGAGRAPAAHWNPRSTGSGRRDSAARVKSPARAAPAPDRAVSRPAAARGPARRAAEAAERRPSSAFDVARPAGLQVAQQRPDLVVHVPGGQRPDMLAADTALTVDDEGFRHTVNAPVDADPTIAVGTGAGEGVTELI